MRIAMKTRAFAKHVIASVQKVMCGTLVRSGRLPKDIDVLKSMLARMQDVHVFVMLQERPRICELARHWTFTVTDGQEVVSRLISLLSKAKFSIPFDEVDGMFYLYHRDALFTRRREYLVLKALCVAGDFSKVDLSIRIRGYQAEEL